MKCPFCHEVDTRVIDSRLTREGEVVRRRRECPQCRRRFTTRERVEEFLPMVIKRDGRRQPFDRKKMMAGLQRAFEKRPVSAEEIEGIAERVESRLQERAEKEIHSTLLGRILLDELLQLDDVAYVRFASVYRRFENIHQFMDELEQLEQVRQRKPQEETGASTTASSTKQKNQQRDETSPWR